MGNRLDIKQHETDTWEWTLEDRDGTVSLASTTVISIELFMWSPNSTGNVIDGSTLGAGSTVGAVTYGPSTADVASTGLYWHLTKVTRTAGGRTEYYPSDGYNEVEIEPSRSTGG